MSTKTVRVGKWNIPSTLFDDYIKFKIMVDSCLDSSGVNPNNTDYERFMRWNLCVSQVMKIHREICRILNIEYSEDYHDEFYSEFHREVDRQTRLKG